MLILLALILVPILSAAQDSGLSLVGSAAVIPLVETFAASLDNVMLTSTVTGTGGGLQQLCAGSADIAAASRAISADETALCESAGISYLELLIAHNLIAFITNPQNDFVQCVTADNLNAIFSPSSQLTNWNTLTADNPDQPLALFVPPADTAAFSILDRVIDGDGVRGDIRYAADDAIIAAVSENAGALGVVSLKAAMNANDRVRILNVNANAIQGCVAPDADSVEQRFYPAADSWFIYVNAASLDKPGLTDLLNAITSDEAAAVVENSGFSAPSAAVVESNRAVVEKGEGGVQFSGDVTFTIPASVAGQVNLVGTVAGRDYAQSVIASFTGQYPGVSVNSQLKGEVDGLRRLCNGEADIALTTNDLSAEQTRNCTDNNITPVKLDLAARSVVLVANGGSPFLACLTTEQIATIWGAASSGSVTAWNQVNTAFPEQPMTLFGPNTGATEADLLMLKAAGANTPVRADTEQSSDALYRAAAVANVEGGLTYMTWAEYQRVLANNQSRIQLVAVDAGAGCVTPDESSMASDYPLSQSFKLIINQSALTRTEVQSFLWFVFSDANYTLFQDAGLIGPRFGTLPAQREALVSAFDAALMAVQAAVETTPEPTSEAAPEATEAPSGS
jgi:phosphate transport system substrate-binding protein